MSLWPLIWFIGFIVETVLIAYIIVLDFEIKELQKSRKKPPIQVITKTITIDKTKVKEERPKSKRDIVEGK